MSETIDVRGGTLALMIQVTRHTWIQRGYGNPGGWSKRAVTVWSSIRSLYVALLKLEQEGCLESDRGVCDNNRKARSYRPARAGRAKLARESRDWVRTTALAREAENDCLPSGF